ncbi:MAG TPA: ATP-binding cassette domain-containing protein [Gemmatimonadaceae bacterium]|jgi:molybdopterin-binding protein|nr:ATP-binding cassette domain-containing protein [Gemmatimonadaceae bacterium]
MIEVEALRARAGRFELHDVAFSLSRGAWGIVLGPAGAGKTTLLETIAGVRRATAGRVSLRGVDVTRLPPERRRVGIVYQHSFLFPHLSVADNVRYGATDLAYASDLARRLGVEPMLTRAVGALSGGERQVVALARALAPRPDILLLDEPFAALDPRSRGRVRRELRAIQRELGVTVLQVTHDFAEAGTLGDLAILLDGGRVVQAAEPARLFGRPVSAAAAEFLGAENVYAGVATQLAPSANGEERAMRFECGALTLVGMGDREGAAHAVVRGEDVTLARERPGASSARNVLDGRVVEVATHGALSQVTVDVSGQPLVATVTAGSVSELGLLPGVAVVASIKASAVHLC